MRKAVIGRQPGQWTVQKDEATGKRDGYGWGTCQENDY